MGFEFVEELSDIGIVIDILKLFIVSIFSYYTSLKMINKFNKLSYKDIGVYVKILLSSILCGSIKYFFSFFASIILLIICLSILLLKFNQYNIKQSLLVTTVSLSINYIIFVIATAISFIPIIILKVTNVYSSFFIIISIYIIMMIYTMKIRKFRNGLNFLYDKLSDSYFHLLILNLSIIILFLVVVISNYNQYTTKNMGTFFVIFSIIMFITIQKSLQLYYKQKLLEQELSRTKEELENKNKEIEELEAENIKISKKAHTLDHKQKALSYKIEEMMKTEISKDEVAEVRERLNKIGKELYTEKTVTELVLTEISEIDNMLKFMQSECSKNKIDFELQVKGNIHYMINNFVSKEDFETLLADHIKNAIIAINHSENINRSILVKIGKFEEVYAVSIYDSGIEFEKQTLNDLGKKPNTTHADEGGTGMGFMNTFDTLRKCKASLIIEEINKPSKENYTKAIIIKFDNKNQFEIKSYRK